jgi:hypothetical protein
MHKVHGINGLSFDSWMENATPANGVVDIDKNDAKTNPQIEYSRYDFGF